MALFDVLQRFSRITAPETIGLPDEGLLWPKIAGSKLTIPPVALPELSLNLALQEPNTLAVKGLESPVLPELDLDLPLAGEKLRIEDLSAAVILPQVEIVDLLPALTGPNIHGTIFVKKEREVQERGRAKLRTKIEPAHLPRKLGPRPTGLDIFELLLPVLMPPAATEFGDELLFPAELYGFQRAGVSWLFENKSALLADDMGLGKTVQAITAFRALVRRSKAIQALVVCPKSVLANWMREIERWAPELVAIRVHGNKSSRRLAWAAYVGKCHMLVTTYETIRSDRDDIRGRVFDVVVADEIQKIKNPRAGVSRAARSLNARRHWGLTGTPLENRLEDIVAVFDLVKPGLFQAGELEELSPRLVRDRIEPYMLRRRKQDVLTDLPQKKLDTKWLELGEAQRRSYDRAENEGKIRLRRQENVTVQHVLQLIQYLKQVCNFDPETSESVKLEFLKEEYLPEACQGDAKALVFSQYVRTLDKLTGEISEYSPLVYTGQLSTGQRARIEEAFQAIDEHKVLLLSLRAGGVGLNLARANYVLHFDRWWNPAVETQAEDRVHRIGQSRHVFVTRLICENTIEERIEELLSKKRILFESVVDELADVSLDRVLSEEELFGLFDLPPPRRARAAAASGTLPQAAAAFREQPGGRADGPSGVIRPETPYSNLLQVRRIIREAEGFLWWADPHFHARALEELIESIDPARVRELRILSGPEHAKGRALREFARFKEELQGKGIHAEWRILSGFAHDRFLVSRNACYNVPPVNSLLKGSYSEINQTSNRPPFQEWWDKATPMEVYNRG